MKKLFVTASLALAMTTSAAAIAGSESEAIDMSLYEETLSPYVFDEDATEATVQAGSPSGQRLESDRQQASTKPVPSREATGRWGWWNTGIHGYFGPE